VTLLIEAPAGYEPERRYILDVVVRDWLGLDWTLAPSERREWRLSLEGASVVLPDVLFATPEDEWLTPASLPEASTVDGLPMLYDGDLLGAAFFMLTRYEEVALPDRDEHGRFPAEAAVASRGGFLTHAIVDAYVELLWERLERTWPRLARKERAFALAISHDIDDPLTTLHNRPRDAVRQLGGDVVVRRDPRLALNRLRALAGDRARDPNNTFDLLMDVSERHGLRSAFYFLAHRDLEPRDGPYLFEDPWVRGLIGRIARRGHEIGYHPSYPTYRDAALTRQELERLQRVAEAEGVEQQAWGGRQHFLRWANPDTWRNWEAAGLAYDSSLGFTESVGFRAGTCHAYRAFDLTARRALELEERPFHVMDVTLANAMALAPDAALQATLDVAAECRRYRGTLGILWHNNSVLRSEREQRWYGELIAAVAAG
jgi:hypothetical protein